MQAGLGGLLPAGMGLEVLVLLFSPPAKKKNAVLKWEAPMFCVRCPLLTSGGGVQLSPRSSQGAGASGLPWRRQMKASRADTGVMDGLRRAVCRHCYGCGRMEGASALPTLMDEM